MNFRMYSSRFNDLSVVQSLQNIDNYYHVLIREPDLFCDFTLEILIKWCVDRLILKWPMCFPDLMYILDRIKQRDMFFCPGCSTNERRHYNLLVHYGKKIK